ncbi:gluconate 2-dehydrogenase subunit 3 family protein [Terriglobus aquaticus]|uniref:Gluconate 2-dehydrogenase subunit 3 family protein n=1 Tax=Terriglobus aquaticus TaxID=940139 RepID=A0ABW9KL92_9BACT|nr:gluconate 2-dehydrogenase subunit 3 family protein [Terriglobus aquaticus]
MKRRRFVWMVAGACVLPDALWTQQAATTQNPLPPPPAPVPWTLGLNSKTPLPHTETPDDVAATDADFFSPVQMATLIHLSSVLLPPLGEMPGAVEAQTPQFLDFLIGDSPASRKALYTGGLDWLEAESRRKNGVPFAKTTPEQADAVLRPWLRTWMSDHPPTEPHADFVNIAHADIRTATMNSRAWVNAETHGRGNANAAQMYWSPIDPDTSADNYRAVHQRPAPVQAAPKSSNTSPSYPR